MSLLVTENGLLLRWVMDLNNILRGVLLIEDDHIFQDNTVGSPLTGFRNVVVKDVQQVTFLQTLSYTWFSLVRTNF